ncbi:MAG: hypothetical protein J6K46_01975 [Sutterella sp.]|nr:hypothetical protein [Sutterella sp.]
MYISYENLSEEQFERLAVAISKVILGPSVRSFCKGPDGGKDGFFEGRAERIPTQSEPWVGKVVIQAKHTNRINASFSDPDFNKILEKEIPKIRSLFQSGKMNHYVIFSNRKMSGLTDDTIRSKISNECGIPTLSIYICGIDELDSYLKKYPECLTDADNSPFDNPMSVDPDDLSDIIETLTSQLKNNEKIFDSFPVSRVSFEKKNTLNNLTPEYAHFIREKYLKYFGDVQEFLADPLNASFVEKYDIAIDEFQAKIISGLSLF